MRRETTARAGHPPRWVALLVAVACALTLVGLMAPPAAAARPGRSGAVWMTHQFLRAGPVVSLRLEWARVSGATTYEIEYAAASGTIGSTEVQGSRTKRTVKVRGDRRWVQAAMVNGLRPGTTYCFQVRGRSSSGYGPRGPLHCKVTHRTSRAVPAAATALVVGTWNTCSGACASSLGAWRTRGPRVRDRILQMNVGSSGRPVDVLAVQEGDEATSYLTSALAGTFTRGCQNGDSTGNPYHDNQSVFVRDDTYDIVANTNGGLNFEQYGDKAHGACWVKVRDKVSGQEVVIVGLHLWPYSDAAGDRRRAQQTDDIADAVTARFPGATIVYAGDFNSHRNRPTDTPLKRLAVDGHDDAYDQSARYLSRPYRNSVCGTGTTVRTSTRWGNHVDRVFAPAGAHVATWEVDYRMDGPRYRAPVLSDHNPVLVSLLLPVAAATP